jgi:hypothetical protein
MQCYMLEALGIQLSANERAYQHLTGISTVFLQ